MNCLHTPYMVISDLLHGMIFLFGMFSEGLLLFFLSRFSTRQMPLKFPFMVLYFCGGLYLASHSVFNLAVRVSSDKQYSVAFLQARAFFEESFGTMALWATTLISVCRVVMIKTNRSSIPTRWWVIFSILVTCPTILYGLKRYFVSQINNWCSCTDLLTRISLYMFRIVPALIMISTNTMLAFQIRQQHRYL